MLHKYEVLNKNKITRWWSLQISETGKQHLDLWVALKTPCLNRGHSRQSHYNFFFSHTDLIGSLWQIVLYALSLMYNCKVQYGWLLYILHCNTTPKYPSLYFEETSFDTLIIIIIIITLVGCYLSCTVQSTTVRVKKNDCCFTG